MSPALVQLFIATFTSVFIAELGDKTQLATMALAGGADHAKARWIIFAGASLALVLSSALGVLAGALVGRLVSPHMLKIAGGLGFLAMGVWMLASKG